jgi:hypothetical protein
LQNELTCLHKIPPWIERGQEVQDGLLGMRWCAIGVDVVNGERLIRDGATATLRRLRSLMSGGRWVDEQRGGERAREKREEKAEIA